MFDAVIFDLDGTLIESESVAHRLALLVFADFGWPVTPALLTDLIGRDPATSEAMLRAALGSDLPLDAINTALRARIRDEFMATGVPLRPGVQALLAQLSQPLAIATSSRHEAAEWKLQRAGLRARFAALISYDCVTRAKPDAEPYLLAAERLGIPPARCLAFEDSDTGARAAQAAGMTVVQVPDMVPTAGAFADLVAPDLLSGARAIGLIPG